LPLCLHAPIRQPALNQLPHAYDGRDRND
jgi:hypothetical protein